MRWIYNAEKENCPLTNRKKGLVPGSGEVAGGFTKCASPSPSASTAKNNPSGASDSASISVAQWRREKLTGRHWPDGTNH